MKAVHDMMEALRIAEEDGACGIMGSDNTVRAVVSFPRGEAEEDEISDLRARLAVLEERDRLARDWLNKIDLCCGDADELVEAMVDAREAYRAAVEGE